MVHKVSRSVTSVEVLGFVAWISSAVGFVLYLIWAYVPAQTLESFGVTYYPSKYWATALPLWFCLALIFSFVAYESLNLMLVEPKCSPHTITDGYAKPPRKATCGGIAPLADLPLSEVCDLLYAA